MKKLLLLLFLIPNLVTGKEIVLSCNGSALVDWCSNKYNDCGNMRNIKNVTFDISVNHYPKGKDEIALSIFITPIHDELMTMSYSATKLLDENAWEISIGDKNNGAKNDKGLDFHDISINRLTGNFRTFMVSKSNEGILTQVYSGNCRKVTTKRF